MKTKSELKLAVSYITRSTEFHLNQISFIQNPTEIIIYSTDRKQISCFELIAGLKAVMFSAYCTSEMINGEEKATIHIF